MHKDDPRRKLPAGGSGVWDAGEALEEQEARKVEVAALGQELEEEGPGAPVVFEEEPEDEPIVEPTGDPEEKEPKDHFQWLGDPETFTFERVVHGQAPLEDEAIVHSTLRIRMRILTAKQTTDLDNLLKTGDIRSRVLGAADEHTLRVLSQALVSINGQRLGIAEIVEAQLAQKPDVFVQLLSEIYNEFSIRSYRLARRGKVKNSSGPPSGSSVPLSGESK